MSECAAGRSAYAAQLDHALSYARAVLAHDDEHARIRLLDEEGTRMADIILL